MNEQCVGRQHLKPFSQMQTQSNTHIPFLLNDNILPFSLTKQNKVQMPTSLEWDRKWRGNAFLCFFRENKPFFSSLCVTELVFIHRRVILSPLYVFFLYSSVISSSHSLLIVWVSLLKFIQMRATLEKQKLSKYPQVKLRDKCSSGFDQGMDMLFTFSCILFPDIVTPFDVIISSPR